MKNTNEAKKMQNILLITGHVAGGPLKASALFLAEALAENGYKIQVVTVDFSLLRKYIKKISPGVPVSIQYSVAKNFNAYVWMPIFHPINIKLKFVVYFLSKLYPFLINRQIKSYASKADIIVVESGTGMLLAPRLKSINRNAPTLLMMCDLMETLPCSPIVTKIANSSIKLFDLVSFPAEGMRSSLSEANNLLFLPQGLDKKMFEGEAPSPFTQAKQVVSVGDMLFDASLIETLAKAYPDWTFHLFGKKAEIPTKLDNVVEHGEIPFAQLVPYLRHADIGLAPYREAPHVEYLSQSSLKLVQYTYCQLPIVAPQFAAAGREHVCAYKVGNAPSIIEAFARAIEYPRTTIDRSKTKDWSENANILAQSIQELKSAAS